MREFIELLFRNRLAGVGAIALSLIAVLALVTPILPLADPDITKTSDRFLRPFSEGHLPSSGNVAAIPPSIQQLCFCRTAITIQIAGFRIATWPASWLVVADIQELAIHNTAHRVALIQRSTNVVTLFSKHHEVTMRLFSFVRGENREQ